MTHRGPDASGPRSGPCKCPSPVPMLCTPATAPHRRHYLLKLSLPLPSWPVPQTCHCLTRYHGPTPWHIPALCYHRCSWFRNTSAVCLPSFNLCFDLDETLIFNRHKREFLRPNVCFLRHASLPHHSQHVCGCVHVHVQAYAHTCACLCMCAYVCVCVCVCACVRAFVRVCMCICVHSEKRMHVCVHILLLFSLCTCAHMPTYACTHADICVCVCVCVCCACVCRCVHGCEWVNTHGHTYVQCGYVAGCWGHL